MNDPTPTIGILYENEAWLEPTFRAFESRGLPYEPIYVDDAAFLLDVEEPHALFLNRTSPSSYLRGHAGAIRYAIAYMKSLLRDGRRVINGPPSFELETSKVEQHLLMQHLGVRTPRTAVFNSRSAVLDLARDFPFPAILKPDTGGSGAYVRRVEDAEELRRVLHEESDLFAPDHLLLLQEFVPSANGAVVRTEFVDGELVYAMRVRPTNTFNLCPADACVRSPADESSSKRPSVEFEPFPEIAPSAVAQAREIVRAAGLDVGGVEYIEDLAGDRVFFDINATSLYRADVCEALGVDGEEKFVDFIEREYHKEVAKLRRGRAAWRSVS